MPFQGRFPPAKQSRLVGHDFNEDPVSHARVANQRFDRGNFHEPYVLLLSVTALRPKSKSLPLSPKYLFLTPLASTNPCGDSRRRKALTLQNPEHCSAVVLPICRDVRYQPLLEGGFLIFPWCGSQIQ